MLPILGNELSQPVIGWRKARPVRRRPQHLARQASAFNTNRAGVPGWGQIAPLLRGVAQRGGPIALGKTMSPMEGRRAPTAAASALRAAVQNGGGFIRGT